MPRYRLVLAARLSALHADRQQGIGIETQDKQAREWAERNGHTVVETVADVKSGKVPPWDRPNLKPWVTNPDLLVQYDGILAFRNDRLSRGAPTDEVRIRQWAEANGKVLLIADGPQWPPRHDGDFWAWTAQAKQAHAEWESIQERVVRAQVELKQRGKLVGRPPFGYTSTGERYDRKLIPTEAGRKYVPEIFRRVIDGDSLNDICKWLNAEGAPLSQPREEGNGWWDWVAGKIVKNETYTGYRRQAYTDRKTGMRVRTVHRCEPLIDGGTWKLANEALKNRPKKGPSNPETRAMLAGAIFCPRCGDSPMYRIVTGGTARKGRKSLNRRAPYYRCAGRGSQRKGCGNMARLPDVDDAVNTIIAGTFDVPVEVKRVTPGNDHRLELEAVKQEIRQLAQVDLPDEEYDRRLAELRAERDRVNDLPVTPGSVVLVATGEVYSKVWEALETHERGAWLTRHGFTVTASREAVSVVQGDRSASLPLG
jgi:site-specific DNA recombinase